MPLVTNPPPMLSPSTPSHAQVKMFILKHRPVYKFTEGPNDADLVTSIYFDNDNLELYQGRLKK